MMNRAKRITSRGWLGQALNVLTFGYFPFTDEEVEVIPIVNLTTLARDFSLKVNARDFSLTTERDFSLNTNARSFLLTTNARRFNLTFNRD